LPASMKRKVGRRKRPRIAFARGPGALRGQTRPLLFIDGKQIDAPATIVKILACLLSHQGEVVPVQRLCELFGYPPPTRAELLILHQKPSRIRRLLAEHDSPYRLAVASGFGYALCEIASEERGESEEQHGRPRRDRDRRRCVPSAKKRYPGPASPADFGADQD